MSNTNTVSKRSIAIALFGAALPTRAIAGDRAFRKDVLSNIQRDTGVNIQSAAAMYNHAKKAAVANGLTEAFGRGVAAVAVAAVVIPEGRWQVVNKATRVVVNAAGSRRAAAALKGADETVVDSEK